MIDSSRCWLRILISFCSWSNAMIIPIRVVPFKRFIVTSCSLSSWITFSISFLSNHSTLLAKKQRVLRDPAFFLRPFIALESSIFLCGGDYCFESLIFVRYFFLGALFPLTAKWPGYKCQYLEDRCTGGKHCTRRFQAVLPARLYPGCPEGPGKAGPA